MSITVKLNKGLDIRLKGKACNILDSEVHSETYGVKPIDFPGLIPKLDVKQGDKVMAGSPLFHDKLRPQILFTSPVSGRVTSVTRGDRRRLLEVVVEKEGDSFIQFGKSDIDKMTREGIIEALLGSGLWPAIRQRPYHIIANPADVPKAIFISGFDTSPLAPDSSFIIDRSPANLIYSGLKVLKKLTDGQVNLVLRGKGLTSEILKKAPDVEISYFSGPHPAGNVGVHIHHLNPINKGEIVWFINLQDIITVGRLFEEGICKNEKIISLTGSEVVNPRYLRVRSGFSVKSLAENEIRNGNKRYISGNVLTGTRIHSAGHLGFYDSQVTVIPEGDYYELFGWMTPGLNKLSFSKTFISSLIPSRIFSPDTNLHGGERAFVMTGLYEKVVPMDIFPMQLLKAILAEDVDLMENLGIYEIAEEDFALCEFICPSKIEIQSIVRKGLNLMIKEMN